MFDLVRWSFVVALTPLALGLAWRLILLIANSIAVGLARPSLDDKPGELSLTINSRRATSYASLSGRTSCMGNGRPLAPPGIS